MFSDGDAVVNGTVPTTAFLTESIVAIVSRPIGQGYWLAATAVPGAGAKIEAAIGWFDLRLGSGAFEDQCEAAVEAAFGTTGRYPSAYVAWLAQRDRHFDWWDAPRGALVFYKPDIFGADGHVAISLGDGYVISTSVNGGIGVAPIDAFQNPLGWTDEPW
jgi:cell wall-associated NlpC family hydrolase